jgi:hypothetical protein
MSRFPDGFRGMRASGYFRAGSGRIAIDRCDYIRRALRFGYSDKICAEREK